jgi:hypothetical protein
MGLGPVDVAIIAFPGNKFTGKIAPALADLVSSGTVRVLDLLFVVKDAEGNLGSFDLVDLDPEVGAQFSGLELHAPGALNDEDAQETSDDLEPNSSVALIAWENVWARTFVDALRHSDAVVIDQIRIPADVAEAVLPDL